MVLSLEKNILATVAYFDVLDYPLTLFEAWKHLFNSEYSDQCVNQRPTLSQVGRVIESEKMKRFIAEKDGLFYLKGRESLVNQRFTRNKISFIKIRRLSWVVNFLKFVPFIRMVGITGRLAMKNAQLDSDWDVLIVTKSGKIWTGRTLITGVTHLLGRRRYGLNIANRVCLNYFISDQSLEVITKDWFSAHEYTFILPIFDTGTFQKFQIANTWIRTHKANYGISHIATPHAVDDSRFSRELRSLGEWLLSPNLIERVLRGMESAKIERNPKTHLEESMVDATDDALIFLPEPKGPKVFEEFKQRLAKLG